eukprot:g62003.t1
MGGYASVEEDLPPPTYPPPPSPPRTTVTTDLEYGHLEVRESAEYILNSNSHDKNSPIPNELEALKHLVYEQRMQIDMLLKGGAATACKSNTTTGWNVRVRCLGCQSEGTCTVNLDTNCRVHTGKWEEDKKCSDFKALDPPLKAMLREQKAKRLEAVNEEMRWILDSEEDSYGRWSCCPSKPGLRRALAGCSPAGQTSQTSHTGGHTRLLLLDQNISSHLLPTFLTRLYNLTAVFLFLCNTTIKSHHFDICHSISKLLWPSCYASRATQCHCFARILYITNINRT